MAFDNSTENGLNIELHALILCIQIARRKSSNIFLSLYIIRPLSPCKRHLDFMNDDVSIQCSTSVFI